MKRTRYRALSGVPTPTLVATLRAPIGGLRQRIGFGPTSPSPPTGGTFGQNGGGISSPSSPAVGLVHASGGVHRPPSAPTTTPTSVVGGSDSGVVHVGTPSPAPMVVVAGGSAGTIIAPPPASSSGSYAMPAPLPDVELDLGPIDQASGLVAQYQALSTSKKVALGAAVIGGLYFLFGRKR